MPNAEITVFNQFLFSSFQILKMPSNDNIEMFKWKYEIKKI